MAGTARKSTGSRKKATKSVRAKIAKKVKTVDIDPNKNYVAEKIGPIYLSWGKHRRKNKKGKIVKEYYLKPQKQHLVWVKWREVFADEKSQGKFNECNWSAEPQSSFAGTTEKEMVKSVLKGKVVWPWPGKEDESYEDRRAKLLSDGYKEWHQAGLKKGKKQEWEVQDAIEPQTGSSDGESNAGSDNDESTSTGTDEPEEEQDEV